MIHTIYTYLKSLDLLKNSPKYWWPSAGEFEVIIGAILTQNTTWKNVEKSLHNLKDHLKLESFLQLNENELKERIKPSGFYNQKAPRLLTLAQNIKAEFKTFENFQKTVCREWLLRQKGIGEESADAILCYGCFREEMVIDAYTKRILKQYGIEFKKYANYKMYIQKSVENDKTFFLQGCENDLNLFYARLHGMFVEYGKKVKLSAL